MTTRFQPQIGDLVEVRMLGRASTGVYSDGDHDVFEIGEAAYGNLICYDAEHVVSVQAAEDVSMAWQPGDVIRAFDGTVLVRRDDGVWVCSVADCAHTNEHGDARVNVDWRRGDVVILARSGRAVAS